MIALLKKEKSPNVIRFRGILRILRIGFTKNAIKESTNPPKTIVSMPPFTEKLETIAGRIKRAIPLTAVFRSIPFIDILMLPEAKLSVKQVL